jgi:hypothetical protein
VTPGSAVISRLVQDCQVCGCSFDPISFQVVVPELGRGFDRVECARSARALGSSGAAFAGVPLAAIVEPSTAAALPAAAAARWGLRPAAAPVATFGLLAVGATAAAFLWLRVLGPETTAFQFSRAAAPPAFARQSVQAHVQAPASAARPAAREPSRRPVTASATALLASSSPTPSSSGPIHRNPVSRPATRPAPSEDGEDRTKHGKGHHKHGKGHHKHGKGHHKHGEGHHKHSWKTGGRSHEKGDHGHKGEHGEHKGKGKDKED